MNTDKPQVSVLMPVFNGEKYLAQAINSILKQSFDNFEFLIIDGGSTDNSIGIIESFNDSRIKLIHQGKNEPGFASALNMGLDMAKGKYIARMDCDDISHPRRLEKQVDFMELNPQIGISGTWIKIFGERKGLEIYPLTNQEIQAKLFFSCPLAHPSVIFRTSLLRKNDLYYDLEFDKICEDYEFWIRCSNFFPLANIPEFLLFYRFLSTSLSHSNIGKKRRIRCKGKIYKKNLAALNIEPTEEEYNLHLSLLLPSLMNNIISISIKKIEKWILKLYRANLKANQYNNELFSQYLANIWFRFCFIKAFRAGNLGFKIWKRFKQFPLSDKNSVSLIKKIKFVSIAFLSQKPTIWNFFINFILS